MPKQINVVGAVIVRDGLVFCAQRGTGALAGMWEFPGGKLEPGESETSALEREIREELDCRVLVGQRVTATEYEYDFGTVNLTTYYCKLIDSEPTLTEHVDSLWLEPGVLDSIEWAPADVPAVRVVQRELASS